MIPSSYEIITHVHHAKITYGCFSHEYEIGFQLLTNITYVLEAIAVGRLSVVAINKNPGTRNIGWEAVSKPHVGWLVALALERTESMTVET